MSDHYRSGTSRKHGTVATFREQMTDYARGDLLLELREQRRMSREKVAHEIGVTTKSLYGWEKLSAAIKWENAQALARFYEKDAEELVTRDPEATGPSSRGQVADVREEFRQHIIDMNEKLDTILEKLAAAEFANALEELEDQPAPDAEQPSEPARDEDDQDSEETG